MCWAVGLSDVCLFGHQMFVRLSDVCLFGYQMFVRLSDVCFPTSRGVSRYVSYQKRRVKLCLHQTFSHITATVTCH